MELSWNVHGPGHLAKSKLGYYFVHQEFGHDGRSSGWFAEYQNGLGKFGKQVEPTGNPQGYGSLKHAQAACARIAQGFERSLSITAERFGDSAKVAQEPKRSL